MSGKKSKNGSILNKDIYDLKNPDYTSYFISPTAFTITKRDFRLASNDVLFFKGTYGLTSKTNVSLTTSLFGSIFGSVKHSINLQDEKTLSFSGSAGNFTASLKDTNIIFTGTDVIFTLGNHQNNVSLGTGFYFIKSNIDIVYDKREFFLHAVTFGIQNQLSKKVYLMVDGYYFTNYNMFTAAAGLKFIIKTRYCLNAGIMPIVRDDIRTSRYDIKSVMIPVISFRMLIERKD
ncbi:MAG: hypothetical protein AB7O47_08935 [Flavobacteriales bacterium]